MNTVVEPIMVTLECHGELQALCGGLEQSVPIAPDKPDVDAAVSALAAAYPRAQAALNRCAFAVGDSLVSGERALQDGDTVALIPPVSGG